MDAIRRWPKRTKIMALAGAGVLLLTLVGKFVLLRAPAPVASPPLVVHHEPVRTPKVPAADSGLPASLRHALAHHKVVVVVLYSSGMPGDNEALSAARQGAGNAHAGFAALDVRDEGVARAAALKLAISVEPSVVVVRRPGTVALLLTGLNDAAVVAQAAAENS